MLPLGAGVRSLMRFSERGRRGMWFVGCLKPELAPGAQRELRRSDIGCVGIVGWGCGGRAGGLGVKLRTGQVEVLM